MRVKAVTNVVDFKTRKSVEQEPTKEDSAKLATEVVKEMMAHIEQDKIPYSRAVVVLLSDSGEVGYRVACYNTPAFTALGMLSVASQNITLDMMGGAHGA